MEFGMPKHVIRLSERVYQPKNEKKAHILLIYFIGFMFLSIIVLSIIFREVIFLYLPPSFYVIMIAVIAKAAVDGGRERMPSPLEIWVYDAYMILYRPRRYYNRRRQQRSYEKVYYSDIRKMYFRLSKNRVEIWCRYEREIYDYRRDGTLSEAPTMRRTSNGGTCSFYILEKEAEFVTRELQEWIPVVVQYEE